MRRSESASAGDGPRLARRGHDGFENRPALEHARNLPRDRPMEPRLTVAPIAGGAPRGLVAFEEGPVPVRREQIAHLVSDSPPPRPPLE
ncbi:MAG: hypothetical protein EA385_04700 [Salinarimonadaceae bacterium]|nr:MAG: hypothetical protein EA385_04700 [Salinarimonadaceae bacterium]